MTATSITDDIITYETGGMQTAKAVIELFAKLIANGMAWTLQGSYGRQAERFIKNGLIDSSGKITAEGMRVCEDSVNTSDCT